MLHRAEGATHYNLRRYLPDSSLNNVVEQFWFVNWKLKATEVHTQKNLPDPNFHLILDNKKLKLIGPVSKTYSYKMQGTGEIIGVKFVLGALSTLLKLPISQYVDKELNFPQLADFDAESFMSKLAHSNNDEQTIDILQRYMAPFSVKPSQEQTKVRELVTLIKNDLTINKVEHLSEKMNLSVRTIQRYFQRHVGLSPKWLIRKYRLHQVIALLEQQSVNFLDLVESLGYTDQSHLIRDFKDIIGFTPIHYIRPQVQ